MLSKSSFTQFLRCSCELWLYTQRKDLAPAHDAETLRRFETGHIVDEWAKKLYPEGFDVMGFGIVGVKNTEKAIADGETVLLQPTFEYSELRCRGDILLKNKDGSWDILEVKSTTAVAEEHIPDVAFQRICMEGAGLKIKKTILVHINNKYVRAGEIEVKKLFTLEDITHEVEEMMPVARKEIPKALEVLGWGTEPTQEMLEACNDPEKCEFRECIMKALGEIEKPALEAGEPEITIDKKSLAEELNGLQYPLYFFDYETYGPAIPAFDGYRPYQQCAFQYSVHVLKSPKAKLVHFEFLMDEFADPAKDLVQSLTKHIGPKGSVIAWHMSFEASRNAELARMVPEHAEFLDNLNERMFDLKTMVSKGYYVDSRFGGSSSLKKVLPVMCPELSYDALAIHEGGQASASWPILTDPALSADKKMKLREDMLAYCGLDTLAMVEIYKKFKAIE